MLYDNIDILEHAENQIDYQGCIGINNGDNILVKGVTFQSLGIGHDDKVMLILKRHYQWWLAMLGLHKLGAVAIPATHMLTKHDIVYRNNAASVKAIICCGDDYVVEQVNQAMPESPTVKTLISIGPDIPEGFHDWMKEWNECAPFVRPEHVNSNEDTLLMLFAMAFGIAFAIQVCHIDNFVEYLTIHQLHQ